ncbi:beta-N-acetylglucosaminidase [Ktedonosporobacter rubrisoli]|uniref:beta-N-acetylhexosaminidase n=1 Tax=Ktedonosporobacter rubrisoli TaxID=2509675 RepID=A0A4P6JIN9_KTERU|nr:beta-N-acetylhexosaminidase [Ktedonosporobacter rubrisoli]QBD74782.1 beta-N-acetylglucosaminidase [Ktedonosporobacter rubrisoli]
MDQQTHNAHFNSAILPQPVSITYDEGYFQLTPNTVIVADEQTQAIGTLLAETLAPASGYALRVVTNKPQDLAVISLAIDPTLTHLGKEGYALQVTRQQVTIRGTHPVGVFYGTQTLRQLLPTDIFSTTLIKRDWPIPAVSIEDYPHFAWRGLMLDPARHFIPKDGILKFIDLLALHKMNVLHLHLTDDQGWRIEIKRYPKLTEIGSQRKETIIGHNNNPKGYDGKPHGGFYTQDDIREIVAYASARGITVVPEIDMPGHAQAAIASYPELGVIDEPVEVGTHWGINPYLYSPSDETIEFLHNILAEVIELFPSLYIHVGGDEATKEQWQASAKVQARIKELGLKDEDELQSWFIQQMGIFLKQKGRKLLGWDEILEGGLPPEATVMSWRGIVGGIEAARARHDVIMAPFTHVYFDYYQSNDPKEPLAIGGYTPLSKVYAFNPYPAELTAEELQHILGAQCTLWSEYIDSPSHLEYMAFPRAIAVAEVVWTPKERCDFTSFCQRLAVHEARLTHLEVNFRPIESLTHESTFPERLSPWQLAASESTLSEDEGESA